MSSSINAKDLRPCPICQSCTLETRGKRSDFAPIVGYAPFVNDLQRFDRRIVVCRTCGLSFIDPMYGNDELAELYGTEAYARFQRSVAPETDYRSPAGQRSLANWANNFRALRIDSFGAATIASKGRATFLDVGCGGGRNMLVFQALGFETTGIEVNATEASQARALTGARVVDASAEQFAESGERFDCVLASHVIEHVTDPIAFIGSLDRLVAPNGIIVLETPVAQDNSTFEGRFRDIYHTHFFDHFTLTVLAQRTGHSVRSWHNLLFGGGLCSSRNWLVQTVYARTATTEKLSPEITVRMRSSYDAVLTDALNWSTAFLDRAPPPQMRDVLVQAARRVRRTAVWQRMMNRLRG